MSVMLGIVVWTNGFRSVHLSAESIPPCAASFSRRARASGPRPPAITFMATTPTPASWSDFMSASLRSPIVKL